MHNIRRLRRAVRISASRLGLAASALGLFLGLVALNGCGGSSADAPLSAEAKQADTDGQKAMEDFMQSKGQTQKAKK